MTKEELAAKLNGREHGNEITAEEEKEARAHGLVVVFGASDDLCEFRGAINDEAGCYYGGNIGISRAGLYVRKCEDDDCPHEDRLIERQQVIKAVWCRSDQPTWTYETDIPHATFEILENKEVYCRGIVLSIEDLKAVTE